LASISAIVAFILAIFVSALFGLFLGLAAARLSGPMAFSATPQSFNFALGGGSFFPGFGPGILISAAMLDALNKNPLKILPANLEEDIYRIAFPY
jgi:hypothetical protein